MLSIVIPEFISMKSMHHSPLALCLLVTLCAPLLAAAEDNVSKKDFGTVEGQPNTLYTLNNKSEMSVSLMNWGANVVNLQK